MRSVLIVLSGLFLVGLFASPLYGHWQPGDSYKMHYPQLPDPNGWDVQATGITLADDWQCNQTGAVSDIHFWGSWKGDIVGQITNAHLSIHADIPVGAGVPFSRPGALLWSWDVEPTLIGNEPVSSQGWYDPATGLFLRPDHTLWYQYNIVNIPNAFVQQVGTIYWLDISVTVSPANTQWGWKTSVSPHFNDDAVWSVAGAGWQPVHDPSSGVSLDLAFVITPEPSTGLILLGGGLLLGARRRS